MLRRISAWQIVRVTVLVLILGALAAVLFGVWTFPVADLDQAQIGAWVQDAGMWGPVIVVLSMTAAIVASPIPSAPIAMAAGAAYGHTEGTVYVVIGAELGALIAFALARFLGRDVLIRWFGDKVDLGWLGSQNALTLTVLASRLMPFVSFDLVSYAAGLSGLHFWRFAVATLAGVIPASFVLAHFGSAALSGPPGTAVWIAIGLGILTTVPLIAVAIRGWKKTKRQS